MNDQRTIFARIRTLIIVTLLSMMIWLLAESRMVRSQSVEAQIAITNVETPGGVELVVRQVPGLSRVRVVEIQLEGSTSGIDELMRQLQNRLELRLGREIPARPGLFEIDLRTELRRSPDLDMHGVTISSVTPERVFIEVDEVETREFPVRVELPEGVETDGAPRVEPTLVRVRAPSSIMSEVQVASGVVSISRDQIEQLNPGRYETIPGGIVEIDGIDAETWATTIEPAQVDVYVTLKSVTQRLELDPLPVQIMIAPGEIGRWQVDIDDSDRDLIGVVVEGPVAGIEALRTKAVRPRAFVTLSFEDLERRINAKPAQIMNLPPGCRVVGTERVVGLQIDRETGSESSDEPAATPSP